MVTAEISESQLRELVSQVVRRTLGGQAAPAMAKASAAGTGQGETAVPLVLGAAVGGGRPGTGLAVVLPRHGQFRP